MATKTRRTSKPVQPKTVRKSAAQRDKERYHGMDPEKILGRAMLVNVCIGNWDGRKHDREVTDKVNKQYHASADAGRYHKHLFGGKVKELSKVISAASKLRHDIHYRQTLPWTDSGWRLLPTANHQPYVDAVRAQIKVYYDAVDDFITVYPRLVKEAKERLNGMFREEDYPSPEALRRKFHAEIDWSPIAAGTDFRVQLPKDELERMAKNVEDRLRESVVKAVGDAWKRLGNAITELRGYLDDGKGLRDTMIERLREVADVLGRLNLTDDAQLEATRSRVLKELTNFNAETLKTDEAARKKAAMSADEILKSMAGLYSPAESDDDSDDE